MKQAIFKIGDKVSMRRKTLYGETEGEIVSIQRTYQETWEDGSFRYEGLCHLENDIKSILLPHTFDGETLTIDYPQRDFGGFIKKANTHVYKFSGYSYSVKTLRVLTLYSEKTLKKI